MEKQTFNITIRATPAEVWNTLFGETTYPLWTAPFAEGSSVETDWKEGSKALFLDGKGQGMVSMIAKNIPNEYMSIRHLGFYKDGVEDMESEEVKKWAGALENYTLKPVGENTELLIDMDISEEYKEYFESAWPKALEKVKELAEKQHETV
jgi:hypothetical protein